MAAYCQVYGVIHFTSPAGWLPEHRDQLRAQRSVTSMGKLYLSPFITFLLNTRKYYRIALCCWTVSALLSNELAQSLIRRWIYQSRYDGGESESDTTQRALFESRLDLVQSATIKTVFGGALTAREWRRHARRRETGNDNVVGVAGLSTVVYTRREVRAGAKLWERLIFRLSTDGATKHSGWMSANRAVSWRRLSGARSFAPSLSLGESGYRWKTTWTHNLSDGGTAATSTTVFKVARRDAGAEICRSLFAKPLLNAENLYT